MVSQSVPLQHQLLAYASDYNILRPASMPHREFLNSKEVFCSNSLIISHFFRSKLLELLDSNTRCPDLEKLDRGEFCVDTSERDALVKEADDELLENGIAIGI